MTKEALTLALEALESSDKLINGSGNHFGLEGAMDGYYSGCFDVDGNNKLLNQAITAIKEALAQDALQALHDERTWVGLTDADKHDIALRASITQDDDGYIVAQLFQLTEAKLKEKNT